MTEGEAGGSHPRAAAGRGEAQPDRTVDTAPGDQPDRVHVATQGRAIARRVARFVAAAPFCCGLTVVLWLVGGVTGSLMRGPDRAVRDLLGFGATSLRDAHWWSPVTGALFCASLTTYAVITILLLTVCVAVERRIGTGRSMVIFAVCQILGVTIASGLMGLGAAAGDDWLRHLAGEVTVGPWPGAIGLLLAGAACLGVVWRRRWRLVALVALFTTVLYVGNQPSALALVGGLVGLALGVLLVPPRHGAHPLPRTAGERRVLVALLVAASAAGPLSTLITGIRFGPLAALDFLFVPSPGDPEELSRLCSPLGAPGQGCGVLSTEFLVQGIGPVFQTLLPVLVLLVLAEGLRRGRRAAYRATVAVNLVFAALGLGLSGRVIADLIGDAPSNRVPEIELWMTRLAPVLLPLVIAAVVFGFRRLFTVRSPRRANLAWALATGAAGLALALTYVGLGWLLREQFQPVPTLRMLLADLPSRLAPVGYLGPGRLHFFPVGTAAIELYVWTGAAFWAVVLGATVVTFWRTRQAPETPGRAEVSEILREWGGPSAAYLTLWRGNRYFFTPGRDTVIAYRVIASVAVTTGPPIGPSPQQAVDAFVAHCTANGWTPCFFAVPESTDRQLRASGFRSLTVASDAVIDLGELTFTGKRWQDVRSARNRARREGVSALWSSFPELPEAMRTQVVAIAQHWLATKGLPEMGFTLGGLAELDDPDVRCVLAVAPDDRVVAVTSWLPGFRAGRTVGWTLDFMRRGPDAFPGAVEFLIATALTQFRAEGAEWASLSGVPLARPAGAPPPRAGISRAMDTLAAVLEPVYGFQSLLAFKAKFDPQFAPLFLCYPDPASLPAVANAVLHAYVPHLGAAQTLGLLRRIARPAAAPRALAADAKR